MFGIIAISGVAGALLVVLGYRTLIFAINKYIAYSNRQHNMAQAVQQSDLAQQEQVQLQQQQESPPPAQGAGILDSPQRRRN